MPWAELMAGLERTAVVAWGVPVTWRELGGDVTGALCVWLLVRRNILTWPIGLLNNVFFFSLFVGARLYADATLQLVFFALGVYGWVTWRRADANHEPLLVRRASRREAVVLATAAIAITTMVSLYLARHTDSPAPLTDACVLALSLVATIGQARYLLESWWVWIAVDVISVPLYVRRALYPTALLYTVYGVLCVVGLREWTRAEHRPSR